MFFQVLKKIRKFVRTSCVSIFWSIGIFYSEKQNKLINPFSHERHIVECNYAQNIMIGQIVFMIEFLLHFDFKLRSLCFLRSKNN